MKNMFFLIVLFFIQISFSSAQSPRLVLLEEFTSATCGPCANANANIHSWLTANPDLFTAIFYHMSWPAPGNDPMYLANTVDNNARRSFYNNFIYVPWSVVDGNVFSNTWNSGILSIITNRSNTDSPFEISVHQSLSPANDEIFLTMLAVATEDISGSLVAHNVVIEKYVQFNTAPGTNGEKNFDHVMKKMLPTKDGTGLPAFESGDYILIETSWPFEPDQVYDIDELAAVSFIQDNATKEVHQAANSSTDPLVLPFDDDLQVMEIANVSTTNCSGVVAPIVTVRNNGNNTVTSFDLNYEVNGGTLATETWTGSLASLERVEVSLPDYTFVPEENNMLLIYSTQPNNVSDEYPKNDTLSMEVVEAPATTLTMILFLKTDNLPEETSWDVKDDQGTVVASHGPYTEPNLLTRDTIELPSEGCYTFTIYDSGGDGLCCAHGAGLYLLQDDEGTEVILGGQFGYYEKAEFNANIVSAHNQFDQTRAIQVYPNPTSSVATATFYLVRPDNVSLNLYNTFGQQVWTYQPGYLEAGEHSVEVDAGNLANGVYILHMTTGEKNYTRKITVTR